MVKDRKLALSRKIRIGIREIDRSSLSAVRARARRVAGRSSPRGHVRLGKDAGMHCLARAGVGIHHG